MINCANVKNFPTHLYITQTFRAIQIIKNFPIRKSDFSKKKTQFKFNSKYSNPILINNFIYIEFRFLSK